MWKRRKNKSVGEKKKERLEKKELSDCESECRERIKKELNSKKKKGDQRAVVELLCFVDVKLREFLWERDFEGRKEKVR